MILLMMNSKEIKPPKKGNYVLDKHSPKRKKEN
jgi:hypothetical protein